MTSVSTLNGQYYTLPTQSGTSTNSTTSTSNKPVILSAQANVASKLLAAESGSGSSDTVLLSPHAQSALSGQTLDSNFALNAAQQQQIAQILDKYKDAPLTQDTFDQVQDDLKAAGLSPSQLAGKDIANSYNINGQAVSILNGTSYNAPNVATEQTKVQNYISQIYSQLQSVISASQAASSTASAS